jgi:hypothetical protein
MRLPEDVAIEVASKLKEMARINGIQRFQKLHVDTAHKIVQCHLLFDTLQWHKYMRGEDYV